MGKMVGEVRVATQVHPQVDHVHDEERGEEEDALGGVQFEPTVCTRVDMVLHSEMDSRQHK